ncbi:MAG TPA: ComEC/Rec2 family competence protein [Arthrobacter sp.]|nr:ComEC/Rec2 family competence protein [Arthrobacter sp.]
MSPASRWQRFVDAATSAPQAATPQAEEAHPDPEKVELRAVQRGPHQQGPARRAVATVMDLAASGVRRLTAVEKDGDEHPPGRTWDLRLVPAALVAWAGAIVFIRASPGWGYWSGSAALMAAAVALVLGRNRRAIAAAVMLAVPLLCLALVSFSAAEKAAERTAGPIDEAIHNGSSVTAELLITADPAVSHSPAKFSGAVQYLIEATIMEATAGGREFSAATPVLVIAGERWAAVQTGQRVGGAGALEATGAGEDVEALFFAETSPTLIQPAGHWDSHTTDIRNTFRNRAATLDSDAAQLLPGMVLGDRSSLGADLDKAMKRTGLTHLTAVSGANCAIVLGVVFLCGYAVRLPRWLAAAVALIALLAFVTLVRPDPSVLRAAVMGTIGIVAVMNGRGRRSPSLLCIAVVLLLSLDPWLSGSYAFILSVLATTGLIVFGSRCARWLSRWMPLWAAQAVAVPVAAQVFCAPVIVLLQPQLVTYSVLANVLVAPAIPVITIVGMIAVLALFLCPPLVPLLMAIAGAGAQWVGSTARFFSSAPAAAIPWPDGATGVALMAALSTASLTVLWILSSPVRLRRATGMLVRLLPGEPASVLNRCAAALVLGTVLGVGPGLLISGSGTVPGASEWSMVACDVGQGDGLVIRTGPHSAVVVDTGPDPELMDRCLRDLEISTVDVLVLTHMHADHNGGVQGVLAGREVKQALVSTVDPELPAGVVSGLEEHGVEIVHAQRGQQGNGGPVHWQVLWPAADHPVSTENNSSIVIAARIEQTEGSALTILLTGDLEEDGMQRLLRLVRSPQGRMLGGNFLQRGVDILKVAHHGADNGGTAVITALRPAMALISVGADNDYGHPAPDIIAALKQVGAHIGRTDEDGRVYIGKQSDVLRMWSER